MKNACFIISSFLLSFNLIAQDIAWVDSNESCLYGDNGSFVINVDPDEVEPSWILPYDLEIENVSTGIYYDFQMDNYVHVVNNLPVGEYELVIHFSDECYLILQSTIEERELNLISAISHHGYIQCEGDKGKLTVILSNTGQSPYEVIWSTGENTLEIENLDPNILYTATVTDANGCESSLSAFMHDYSIPIEINSNIVDVCGAQKGSIDLTVHGADPFNFEWEDGYISEDRDQLTVGNYCVTITDVNNCEKSECFDVGGVGFEIILDKIKHKTDCELQLCDGEINITPYPSSLNYSYSWIGLNSGFQSNEEDISGLCEDSYKLVLTDNASGCSTIKWFFICCCDGTSDIPLPCEDLGLGSQIYIDPVDVTIPSGPNTNDGAIDITAWGGGTPKFFSWEGPNGYRSNEEDISNLAEGNYCVTVSDGCSESWACRWVRSCETIMNLITFNQDDACGQMSPDGKIELDMPTPNYFFSFQWSNGANAQNVYNLLPGLYSVTVTETNLNCEAILEFEIGIIDQLEITSEVLQHVCAGESNGSISLDYAPKRPEDDAYWDDEPWNHGYQRPGLDPGTYCISIHNKCGYLRHCIEIQESTIDADVETSCGCEDDNEITVNASGSFPPFTYEWSNGQTTPTISNIPYGTYSVTITDALGCKKIEQVDMSLVSTLSETPACQGMWDGSITLKINNCDNKTVDVSYLIRPCEDCDFFPIVTGSTEEEIIFTLRDLSGSENYRIRIIVHGCLEAYFYDFNVGEEAFEQVFSHHEKDDDDVYRCYYDLVCKDNILEDQYSHRAYIENSGLKCGGIKLDCGKVEYYCDYNNPPIATKDGKAVLRRRGKAHRMAELMGYTNDEINAIMNRTSRNPCDWIVICENDPLCTSGGTSGGEFGGQVTKIRHKNGCTYITCRQFLLVWTTYKICGTDFIPSYIRPYIDYHRNDDDDEPCTIVTNNLGEMIRFMNDIIQDHPDFVGSTTYEKLLQYEFDPRKYCAEISYCSEDFEFVYTDINTVICRNNLHCDFGGTVTSTCVIGPYFDDNYEYIVCMYDWCDPGDDICNCLIPMEINKYYQNFIPRLKGGTPSNTNLISGNEGNSEFIAFNHFVSDSVRHVNALVSEATGSKYLRFNPDRRNVVSTPHVVYVSQNVRTEEYVLLMKDSLNENVYSFIGGMFPDETIHEISSPAGLDIEKMIYKNGDHILHGRFYGHLIIGDEIIDYADGSEKRFILRFSGDLSSYLYDDLVVGEEVNYIVSDQGSVMVQNPSSDAQEVYYNGSSVVLESGGIYTLKTMQDSTLNFTEVVTSIGSFDILNADLLLNGTFVLGIGVGMLSSNNTTVNISEDSLYALQITQSGELSILDKFAKSAIDLKHVSVAYDSLGSIFLGLNYQGDMMVDDTTQVSQGGYDITILKYNLNGNLETVHTYGSPDDEKLMALYYNDSRLFLGGELYGSSFRRKIGDIEFVKFNENTSHAFVSYLIDTIDFAENGADNLIKGKIPTRLALQEDVLLYPNPSSEAVVVQMGLEVNKTFKLKVIDLLGKVVYEEADFINPSVSKSNVVNVSHFKRGLYVFQFISDDETISTEFIKK